MSIVGDGTPVIARPPSYGEKVRRFLCLQSKVLLESDFSAEPDCETVDRETLVRNSSGRGGVPFSFRWSRVVNQSLVLSDGRISGKYAMKCEDGSDYLLTFNACFILQLEREKTILIEKNQLPPLRSEGASYLERKRRLGYRLRTFEGRHQLEKEIRKGIDLFYTTALFGFLLPLFREEFELSRECPLEKAVSFKSGVPEIETITLLTSLETAEEVVSRIDRSLGSCRAPIRASPLQISGNDLLFSWSVRGMGYHCPSYSYDRRSSHGTFTYLKSDSSSVLFRIRRGKEGER